MRREERQHIKLALDTTYILGRGAVKDTYNLLADGIVQVLRGLAKLVRASCWRWPKSWAARGTCRDRV